MEDCSIAKIMTVIASIEAHLNEKLDLETVANAVHYSKYHLHRMFTSTVGMTPHDYIQRRQLTEAAKLLVFSQKPILEVALLAGYESQQAFTTVFKALYKQTPLAYRENEVFYPLQLAFTLHSNPSAPDTVIQKITYATPDDIPAWMDFVSLVIDGFPCFDPGKHLTQLKHFIKRSQALMMWDKQTVAGAAAFSPQTGSIDFLGVHPQYRKHGIANAFLDFILSNLSTGPEICITTFRQGDKADTGQRAAYQRLGFAEAELLTEFGYPTQRLILPAQAKESADE